MQDTEKDDDNRAMKILVVDDEEMAHQLVTAVVRVIEDVSVESAYGAKEALELARKAPPDLIIPTSTCPRWTAWRSFRSSGRTRP